MLSMRALRWQTEVANRVLEAGAPQAVEMPSCAASDFLYCCHVQSVTVTL